MNMTGRALHEYLETKIDNFKGPGLCNDSTVFQVDDDVIYPSRIGFRFSESDFTRTLDLSQSQNPRLSIAKPLVLFNRKIKISGNLLP